jgi:prolipoprotein diacylglyceryltransferase
MLCFRVSPVYSRITDIFFYNFQSEYDPNHFCISQKSFAIGIAIAGLILMVAVVVAILILVSKRRRKNLSTTGKEPGHNM